MQQLPVVTMVHECSERNKREWSNYVDITSELVERSENSILATHIEKQLATIAKVLSIDGTKKDVKFMAACNHRYHQGVIVHDIAAVAIDEHSQPVPHTLGFNGHGKPASKYWVAIFKMREVKMLGTGLWKIIGFEMQQIKVVTGSPVRVT